MWHQQHTDAILDELSVRPETGLTRDEAALRLQRHGENRLSGGKSKSILRIFFEQINSPLIYILIGAAVISGVLRHWEDSVIILAVILINAIVGVIQESKAAKAIDALKRIASPKAVVRRDGVVQEIDSTQVVPGDVIVLDAGRVVPCDVRLIESANLKIEESALTGESVPVEKDAAFAPADDAGVGDRLNMAYSSTIVTYGRGVGVAVATGMRTEIGGIAKLLSETEDEQTPLQAKLAVFGRKLGIVILILCAVMFGVAIVQELAREGVVAQEPLLEFFLTAVSLAVAAIPEGLPAIVTIVLAIGVQKMSRRNAIVRSLPAVETLGSVTIICSDKTGTLTQNLMTVTRLATAGGEPIPAEEAKAEESSTRRLFEILALCNDATYSEERQTGDPTEVALVAVAHHNGLDKTTLDDRHPRVAEVPFDSDRKMMSTIHEFGDRCLVMTKGALDELLRRCTQVMDASGTVRPIQDADRQEALESARDLSRQALRVLGAAYREVGPDDDSSAADSASVEHGLVYTGLVGMIDPPREEVKVSVAECVSAGIVPVMITGDHRATAFAIAKDLGIAQNEDQAISGSEIDDMTDEQLTEAAVRVRVFARVSPEHKVRIVTAFRRRGNIVSMTGDGVNDAPSLQAADIGVAMGITGTDVAKGASDMVLTDDDFSTIVAAVEEGRNIFANIKKVITFLLSCNAGEIVAVFGSVIAGLATPLQPIHILWVNLITDTFPALALGMDPGDPNALKRKPRKPNESLFAGGTGPSVILNGILIGAITLTAYLIGRGRYPGSLSHAQTLAFAVLSVSQLFHAFDLRHFERSLFSVGPFSNKYLLGALGLGLVLQFSVIMIPPVASVFNVTPLTPEDWWVVVPLAVSPIMFNEIGKLVARMVRRSKAD